MYFYSGVDMSHKFYEGVEDYNGTFGDPLFRNYLCPRTKIIIYLVYP